MTEICQIITSIDWVTLSQVVSALAAMLAVFFAYRTVTESNKTRTTSNFLVLYDTLIALERQYAMSAPQSAERPTLATQFLNHCEVIAALYIKKEISQEMVDDLMKDYLIAQFTVFKPSIQAARRTTPTTYTHILTLIKQWDFKDKQRDFGDML